MVFLDESRCQPKGKEDYFATLAGVAFEEAQYDDFCRKFFRLKAKFFKLDGLAEFPLRGRRMLNPRAFESYRKAEFIRELFSLCRLHKVVTFGSTRLFQPAQDQLPAELMPMLPASAIALTDRSRKGRCSILLVYVIERVNSFMLEIHPGQSAQFIFPSASAAGDSEFSAAMMDLIYKTPYGSGFHGVLGAPLFAPAPYSPGLQAADLFAYIINQHHAGRIALKDCFDEVESMQFISAFRQDDFDLKGINLVS
ncbi:MAG TPA: DUF3800 domain-containing protein [bacterium]